MTYQQTLIFHLLISGLYFSTTLVISWPQIINSINFLHYLLFLFFFFNSNLEPLLFLLFNNFYAISFLRGFFFIQIDIFLSRIVLAWPFPLASLSLSCFSLSSFVNFYISSSLSSSLSHADCTDFQDFLSSSVPIIHQLLCIFQTTSCVLASPAVKSISYSSYLDGFRDGR